MDIVLDLNVSPGTFYELPNGFLLPVKDLAARTSLVLGLKLPVSCMFDIYVVMIDKERVGFYFTSRFDTVNGGGYLLTTLKGKGEATEVDVLVRTSDLVVYHYPNKGTLVVSPKVSNEIETIYLEQ